MTVKEERDGVNGGREKEREQGRDGEKEAGKSVVYKDGEVKRENKRHKEERETQEGEQECDK